MMGSTQPFFVSCLNHLVRPLFSAILILTVIQQLFFIVKVSHSVMWRDNIILFQKASILGYMNISTNVTGNVENVRVRADLS